MTQIIGRDQEIKRFKRALESGEAGLIAVYGRRRIGKTFLISHYFRDKGVYFELTGVSGGKTADQLRRFPSALQEAFHLEKGPAQPKDWSEAFNQLRSEIDKLPKNQKVILFFDELPWLATARSDLMRSLEHTWNRYFSSRPNLIMVLCGSAASWMMKKIINNRGGLYGRLTDQIHLEPFSLAETEGYLESKNIFLNRKQIVEIYMALGGIAKYLNFVERGRSPAQIIQDLCFSPGGFLSLEFRRLFESLFDDSERHRLLIRALAKHHTGLTLKELIAACKRESGGRLSEALEELEASGFVQFIPFYGRKKRDGRYRLIDEYSLFYLKWVEGVRAPSGHYWQSQHQSPTFLSWAGYAFETICMKHIRSIIEALDLSVVAESMAYWKSPGGQIDLIIDRRDKCMNLCEIKFYGSEYVMKNDYADKLNARRELFREHSKNKKALFNTLITPFGAKENPAFHSSVDQQLTLDAIFQKS